MTTIHLVIATASTIITTVLAVGSAYWSLHREIGELRERMAKIEGKFEMVVKS